LKGGGPSVAHQLARIEHFFAFCDVGQQNIDERMLAVKRRPALILGDYDPPERREIEFAKGIVLRAKQTSPFFTGFNRIDPPVHDPPAYECFDDLIPVAGMKQQPVHAVRAFIDGKFCERHWHFSSLGTFRSARPISPGERRVLRV
jgi:hypothetical protein